MKTVWQVEAGEYSDRYTMAVCATEEQAMGVAVKLGGYVGGTVELWEPEDGIPPYKPIYTVIVRPGRDSSRPIEVTVQADPVEVDAVPTPRVTTSPQGPKYPWARAERYLSAEEGERAARDALAEIVAAT